MNLLKRIFTPKQEARAIDPSWSALSGMNAPTGSLVNPRMAENLSTVFACVGAISSSIASLPVWVYSREGNTRTPAEGHPLMGLVRLGPNRWQTWPEFVEWLLAQVLLRGNALAEIVTDTAGRVVELKPIPWEWVSVQLLPNGRLAFDVTEITSIHGGQGRMRRLLQHEVLHLKDRSDDGLLGRPRLHRAASVVAAGLAVQTFSEAMYQNGINPNGAFKLDGKISDDGRKHLREQIREMFAGPSNAARFMILDQGLDWQAMSVTPEDAELLASRRFTTEELARIFQVPPPLVGIWDHSTFTNSETAGKWFAQHTLTPWIRKIEAAFIRSVFTDSDRATYELEIDLSGFMRGDHAARWQGYQIAVQNRILTPNEVREAEGWNPRPDGDGFEEKSA